MFVQATQVKRHILKKSESQFERHYGSEILLMLDEQNLGSVMSYGPQGLLHSPFKIMESQGELFDVHVPQVNSGLIPIFYQAALEIKKE